MKRTLTPEQFIVELSKTDIINTDTLGVFIELSRVSIADGAYDIYARLVRTELHRALGNYPVANSQAALDTIFNKIASLRSMAASIL